MTLADRLKGIKRGGGVADGKYFPMSNTSVNPIYLNTGNTGQSINGQTYTFIPNDGIYFDEVATNFTSLFRGSSLATEPDMLFWDVSRVVDMTFMFFQTSSFNQDLSSWNVSSVTSMYAMFYLASSFNQDLSSWNVSSVIDMDRMFYQTTSFNQDLSSWNVSSVIDMDSMFSGASSFNQDLSNWCVSLISSLPTNFDTGAISWVLPRPIWGTCPA